MSRTLPNLIITGTPGTGKTTHCELLAERTGLKHLSVNQVVKDRECHEGWDDEFQSWVVDEDKVRFTVFFFELFRVSFSFFVFSHFTPLSYVHMLGYYVG
jgi:broad-specificity NMP kinase